MSLLSRIFPFSFPLDAPRKPFKYCPPEYRRIEAATREELEIKLAAIPPSDLYAGYFPLDAGPEFEHGGHAQLLHDLGEKPLHANSDELVLRLSINRSFGRPVSVKLRLDKDGVWWINRRRAAGTVHPNIPGQVYPAINESWALDKTVIPHLMATLTYVKLKYFKSDWLAMDGSTWVLEGTDAKAYYLFGPRTVCPTADQAALGEKMLTLGGFDVYSKEDGHYG